MRRKTQEEKEKEFQETTQAMKKYLTPIFKIKLCSHHKDMPAVCGVFELPFQPKNGDIICVKPKDDPNKGSRLTFLVNNLIYDIEEGYFIMRPDIIQHIHKDMQNQSEIDSHIDPLDN